METIEFLKNVGIMSIGVAFIGGVGYWITTSIKKAFPNLKYQFKYKFLKSKYNEEEVKRLMDYNQAGMDVDQVNKFLLVTGGFDEKKAKELSYIYTQIQSKGGKKNE